VSDTFCVRYRSARVSIVRVSGCRRKGALHIDFCVSRAVAAIFFCESGTNRHARSGIEDLLVAKRCAAFRAFASSCQAYCAAS
jgi:hypothetical protein